MRLEVQGSVQLREISRAEFQAILDRHKKAGDHLEKFPALPKSHTCEHCPIDPHTMHYVVQLLSVMRNTHLARANTIPTTDGIDLLVSLVGVNVLDMVLASVCGEFAYDLGERLVENYI